MTTTTATTTVDTNIYDFKSSNDSPIAFKTVIESPPHSTKSEKLQKEKTETNQFESGKKKFMLHTSPFFKKMISKVSNTPSRSIEKTSKHTKSKIQSKKSLKKEKNQEKTKKEKTQKTIENQEEEEKEKKIQIIDGKFNKKRKINNVDTVSVVSQLKRTNHLDFSSDNDPTDIESDDDNDESSAVIEKSEDDDDKSSENKKEKNKKAKKIKVASSPRISTSTNSESFDNSSSEDTTSNNKKHKNLTNVENDDDNKDEKNLEKKIEKIFNVKEDYCLCKKCNVDKSIKNKELYLIQLKNDESIRVHKSVLICSNYFKVMFQNGWSIRDKTILLTNIDKNIFLYILLLIKRLSIHGNENIATQKILKPLNKISKLQKQNNESVEKDDEHKNDSSSNSEDEKKQIKIFYHDEWILEFCEKQSYETSLKILIACEYLGIETLIDTISFFIYSKTNGKTNAEIIEQFNITIPTKNMFFPAELEV